MNQTSSSSTILGSRDHLLHSDDNDYITSHQTNFPQYYQDNGQKYDVEYDRGIKELLTDLDATLDCGALNYLLTDEKVLTSDEINTLPKQIGRDFYFYEEEDSDEFDETEIPDWYKHDMLNKKQKEMESRLEYLANNVINSEILREHVNRQVEDHGIVYCRHEKPKHPPFGKPWTNCWKFSCTIGCSRPLDSHEHTLQCRLYLLEHDTGISCKSDNILVEECPDFIMGLVQDFESFVNGRCRQDCCKHKAMHRSNLVETYTDLLIKANHKGEVLLTVEGKGILPEYKRIKLHMLKYRKMFNVVSVFGIDRIKKNPAPCPLITSGSHVQHQISSDIALEFSCKALLFFNVVQVVLLKKFLVQCLELNKEKTKPTLVELGCGIGIISNMLAPRCSKVVGLDTGKGHLIQAESIASKNSIYNTSFIESKVNEVHSKLSSSCLKSRTVAVVKQDSVFGKNVAAMRCLKQLPTLHKIIIYGPFCVPKDYVPSINVLTHQEDYHEAIPFHPVLACMLDKSPKNIDDFNIVLVFERESLIIEDTKCNFDLNVQKSIRPKGLLKVRNDLYLNSGTDSTIAYPRILNPKKFDSAEPKNRMDKINQPINELPMKANGCKNEDPGKKNIPEELLTPGLQKIATNPSRNSDSTDGAGHYHRLLEMKLKNDGNLDCFTSNTQKIEYQVKIDSTHINIDKQNLEKYSSPIIGNFDSVKSPNHCVRYQISDAIEKKNSDGYEVVENQTVTDNDYFEESKFRRNSDTSESDWEISDKVDEKYKISKVVKIKKVDSDAENLNELINRQTLIKRELDEIFMQTQNTSRRFQSDKCKDRTKSKGNDSYYCTGKGDQFQKKDRVGILYSAIPKFSSTSSGDSNDDGRFRSPEELSSRSSHDSSGKFIHRTKKYFHKTK